MKKALLFLVAVVYHSSVRGVEEAIQFVPPTKTHFAVTEGRRFSLEPQLSAGTAAKFQWFHIEYGSMPLQTNAIPGATNINYTVEFADTVDWGGYLLKATNSVSEALLLFNVDVFSPPSFFGGMGAWEGLMGETFAFEQMFSSGAAKVRQWFKNDQPIAPPAMSGVLDEQTVGTYWFVGTNDIGDEFVSPRATLRIAPVTETTIDFRRVIDQSFLGPNPGDAYPSSEQIHEDGSVTFRVKKLVYSWKRGVIEKIFDLNGAPEIFAGADWVVRRSIVSEDHSFTDIEAASNEKVAFVRKDAEGFKTLGVVGMPIDTEPPLAAADIRAPKHAAGKTAFWAIGPAVPWPNNRCYALKVYDGGQLTEWFNSSEAWPTSLATYAPWPSDDPFENESLGFDGTTAAFVAQDMISHRSALVAVTANGQPFVVAATGDLIPGTTNRLRSFDPRRVIVRDGKILFKAAIIENFVNRCLVEHDPSRSEKLKLIAIEGQVAGGLTIGAVYPLFDYLSDGTIVFTANAGRYHVEAPWSSDDVTPLDAIFRSKDGALSVDVDGRELLGGQQMVYTSLKDAAGTNYILYANGNLYTTAPGADRPTNARLTTQKVGEDLQASWTGEGILQSTSDFVRWTAQLYAPGVVTNDVSKSANFYRVFYP